MGFISNKSKLESTTLTTMCCVLPAAKNQQENTFLSNKIMLYARSKWTLSNNKIC